MLNRKQLVKRSLHFVLSVNLVFYSLAPAFSTPVFASTKAIENNQSPVISEDLANIQPVDKPIEIEPAPDFSIQPIDIGQIKPVEILPEEIVPDINVAKDKFEEQSPLLDAPGVTPLDMYDNRDNAGKKPSDQVGQYNVDEFTGLFSYSYPLQIPAGRNNLQPTINLQYNHRQQNLGSFVGFGWELNMPSVIRDNRSGIDKLYIDNYFRLNLNGSDILEPVNVDVNGYGVYGKKVESDFLQIEFASSSNSWIVTDTLGTIYTFGTTAASRQDNPNDNTEIYQWMLEEIRDTNDNFVRYEYYKDSGQIYPKKIFYTGHGSTDGLFEVDFEPFANGLPNENNLLSISYQAGFAVQTKYLLDKVDIKINSQLVTSYQLDLQINEKQNKYLLKQITPTFYKDAQAFVKDEENFIYSQEGTTYRMADDGLFDLPNNYTLGGLTPTFDLKRDMFVDLDVDGLSDYVRMYCDDGNLSVNVWRNNGLGSWATSTSYTQNMGGGFNCSTMYGASRSIPISFANINGDSLIDMITDNIFYINTGSGWQTESGSLPVSLSQSSSQNQPPMNVVMFQDMNNDGYDDIIYQDHPNNHISNISVYIRDYINNAWVLNNNYSLSVDLEISDCLIYGGDPYAFVDYNNDGLLDVFYNFNCSFFQYNPPIGEAAYLNNGTGFVETTSYDPLEVVSYFSSTSSTEQHVSYFTDIDADSVDDFAVFSRSVSNNISNGNFNFTISSSSPNNLFNIQSDGISYLQQQIPVAIVDLNGDQKQDVMHAFDDGNIVYLAQGEKSDILKQIDQQSGSKLYINYDFSTREKDQNNNLLNPDLPFNLYVVKEVVVDNGTEQYQGYQYQYSEGKTINYPTEKIKDTYGFAKVVKKVGQARPDVDLGDGSDGAFVSSGNETWITSKNFTSLHIQAGHTITVEPNVLIKVQGEVVIDGILSAQGMGANGGSHNPNGGYNGLGLGGGGGGYGGAYTGGSGGGGGHAVIGQHCYGQWFCNEGYGAGGMAYGHQNLEPIFIGSGGGGGQDDWPAPAGSGGDGGGIIQIFANNLIINGQINTDGEDGISGGGGQAYGYHYGGSGGGGSGGSIYIKIINDANVGNNLIHSKGGQGGTGERNSGGAGADGRIRIEAKNIIGQTDPVYFSEGKFKYSIDNELNDESLQKQINYYHTAKDDDFYLHGKIKKAEKYNADDHLINKSFVTWQEEDLNNNRKFVYNNQQTNTNVDVVLDPGAIEFSADPSVSLLFHMNGLVGSAEKKSEVVQDISDLIEYNGVGSDYGFDGAENGSYNFDGVDDYLKTTTQADVNFSINNFTIEAWIKTDSDGVIVRKWEDASNVPGWMMNINEDGYARFAISQGGDPGVQAVGNADLRDNQWHYLVGVRQGLNIYIYVDGELAGSNVTYQIFNVNNISDIYIGWRSSLNYFSGSVDEVRVSSMARSANVIHNYYNYITVNSFYYSTANQSDYDLTNGNLLTENNLGQVELDTNTGEILDTLVGDEKTTTYDYAQNEVKHILSAPKEKVIADSVNTKSQELYYDDLAFGEVNKVNLTKEDYLVNNVQVNRDFNDYGLAIAQFDPKNATTTILYDDNQLYPNQSINALNQSIYTTYNLLNGQLASSTAANGAMTVNSFDAFGRLVKTEISSPSSTTELLTKQEISYQDFDFPRYKETKDYFDVNQYKISREYYDGLDRVIQTKTQTASSTQWSTQDISYDTQGRVARQSLPYISQNIDYSAPDLEQLAKSYAYDAQDRVLTETTPVGTTTYIYDSFTTSIYDANNNRKDLTKDAYGNLIEVKEYNGQDVYTTTYEYSLTNKLTKITDALGNIRNFVYDDLDNLVSQNLAHVSNAQNIPATSYTYDKNGNVLTETNFNGQTITYSYDALNRVLTESLNGSLKIRYTYDQSPLEIGYLSKVEYLDNGNWQEYDYDVLGRKIAYRAKIGTKQYSLTYNYNLDGSLLNVTYPDSKVASYIKNSIGQDETVIFNNQTLANNLNYNVNGQLTHLERANGLVTDYTYDPDQAYRLTNLSTSHATSTLQNISYTYDAVGNILNITDNANTDLKKSATYQYDDLNRLSSTTVSYLNLPANSYSQNFVYNAVGNITFNSDLGNYNYNNSNPHQVSSINTQDFTYDNAGNLLNDENKTLTWDWRSRMTKSRNTGGIDMYFNYFYDNSNQRLAKQTKIPVLEPIQLDVLSEKDIITPPPATKYMTSSETHYLDQYFEKEIIDNKAKDHVFINNQKLATINDNDNPYYILSDHLSSSNILVNSLGLIAEVSDYKPFGRQVYNNTTIDLKDGYTFTGKEFDEENGLQYFGARYMDNNVGRFVSVDPVALVLHNDNRLKETTKGGLQQLLANPQNLNGYAYAVNNPVIMKDDDGNFAFLIPLAYYAAVYGTPMLITAIASAGAYISAKEFGQAVGYTMEGRDDLAQQHFDNSIMADVAVASGAGGLLYAESMAVKQNPNKGYVVPGQKITSSSQVPSGIKNQIPENWGSGRQTDNGKGWVWTDPKNKYNEVRYMSGNPTSQFESQHKPYVVQTINNNNQYGYLDINGDIGVRHSSETHINADIFRMNY